MINSRRLGDLKPKVGFMAARFIADCRAAGIEVLITQTLRDWEYQDSLYAQGRTVPGKKVTNAKGGESWHNFGCAFDFVPLDVNRNPIWDNDKLFPRCGEIGKALGLEWGGDFHSIKDLPHLQFTAGYTLSDMRVGKFDNAAFMPEVVHG